MIEMVGFETAAQGCPILPTTAVTEDSTGTTQQLQDNLGESIDSVANATAYLSCQLDSCRSHVCHVCNRRFRVESQLITHLSVHDDLRYTCEVCGIVYRSFSSIKQHKMKKHDFIYAARAAAPRYFCPFCNRGFQYNSDLLNHQGVHDDIARFPCDKCNKVYRYYESLRNHSKQKHDIIYDKAAALRHFCPICNRGFTKKSDLLKHQGVHEDVGRFPCGMCNTIYRHASDLKSHIKEKHDPNYDKAAALRHCPVCNRGFTKKANLLRHQGVHDDVGRFPCDKCSKVYRYSPSLWKHKKQKHDVNYDKAARLRYVCEVCNHGFSAKANLLNHQGVHDNVGRFPCDMCNKVYRYKQDLKSHKKEKHDPNYDKAAALRHVCPVCNTGFTKKSNLLDHQGVHDDAGRFSCDKCTKVYRHRSHLLRHKKKNHEGNCKKQVTK